MSGKPLNFSPLDRTEKEMKSEELMSESSWRRRREINPTVQMSVRMREETYERFRALCKRERRTNGDMLEVLMEGHFFKDTEKK